MRKTIYVIITLLTCCFIYACGGETQESEQTQQSNASNTDTSVQMVATNTTTQPPCNINGEVLAGNFFAAKEAGIYIIIKADESTADEELGPSHRLLEVYDKACQLLQKKELPINQSPDFPYYLAEINYNNANQVIAIRGFNTIYIFNIKDRKLLPVLRPAYLTERMGVDAQSGRIDKIEVWENYLIGYARDYGSFVFNISNPQQPQAVMPYAEFRSEKEVYHPLFLLASGQQNHQIILPSYDKEEGLLHINPILSKPSPLKLNMDDAPSTDQQVLIMELDDDSSTKVAIDLLERKQVELVQ